MSTHPPPTSASPPPAGQTMSYQSPDQITQQYYQHNNNQSYAEKGQSGYQQQPPPQYGMLQPNSSSIGPVTPLHQLGDFETYVACPYCNHRVMTRTRQENSTVTILVGIGLGCLCICAACLPCMCNWFQNVQHDCSNCGKRLATVRENGTVQVYDAVPTGMPNAPAPMMANNGQQQIQRPESAQVRR